MFKNYLKIALRNIAKYKSYSLINIAGLAVGMAVCILIMLWVQYELSYDRFNENAAQLYYVAQNQAYDDGRHVITTCTPGPLAQALKDEFPGVVDVVRYTPFSEPMSVRYGETSFTETIRMADNSIFSLFSFPLLAGDPEAALTQPRSIVLSQTMAEKYFGEEDPMGKTLTLANQYDFTVTGVMQDIPQNSTVRPEILAPFEFKADLGEPIEVWGSNNYDTIVQLQQGTDPAAFAGKIVDVLQRHTKTNAILFVHPLLKDHLYSLSGKGGLIVYVRLFALIAILILVIACINFMNLATARSERRAREVGLRKVVGAQRKQLIAQFLGESILLALLSLFIAVFLVEMLLPLFNNLAGKELTLDLVHHLDQVLALLAITVLTGILAGSYPAFFLSTFLPVRTMRGSAKSKSGSKLLRRILVTTQFALSIMLIICTTVIYQQIMYMQTKDLGLNKENVVRLPLEGLAGEKYASVKAELLKNPHILSVTAASHWPSMISSNTGGSDWEGKDPALRAVIGFTTVDFDYTKTFDIKMSEGRFYSLDHPSDSTEAIVLNRAAIDLMGMENPLGRRFSIGGTDFKIIGVTDNFNFKPLNWKIEPLMMLLIPSYNNHVFVKVAGDDVPGTMAYIEDVYQRMNPDCPFDFTFVDEKYDRMYKSERRMASLFKYFTILALFISSLGLFGLAAFAAEQRTKEIGIRKVLGATVTGIVGLVSREFVLIVLTACLIAGPLAYYFMQNWLQSFAYRTGLSLWIFLLAGAGALLLALIIVSSQAIKAATADPVKSLRYE